MAQIYVFKIKIDFMMALSRRATLLQRVPQAMCYIYIMCTMLNMNSLRYIPMWCIDGVFRL